MGYRQPMARDTNVVSCSAAACSNPLRIHEVLRRIRVVARGNRRDGPAQGYDAPFSYKADGRPRLSGPIRLMAPCSSSAPHRPQLLGNELFPGSTLSSEASAITELPFSVCVETVSRKMTPVLPAYRSTLALHTLLSLALALKLLALFKQNR